ncbi:hypothetical protein [Kitasatospora sp. DSM 101779]|uniref:hypothetical protein n=1 Tax=Kitasatospora sp. DSM 101779 TaxID=2853165 RepID=UPI0021D9DAAB|nr:hypothetical protein [Kitasatospora sp. DSM 101779]MCU7824404.1 hypothetical protein [Kitasatospora sp. DSM 101779]
MRHRPTALLCCTVLLAAAGCTTVSASADRVPRSAGRTLDAAALRAAAVTAADLGDGWTVTVAAPERGSAAPPAARLLADVPACQPVLDALAPAGARSGPLAQTDLSASRAGRPRETVNAGLLAFGPGGAERVRSALDQLLSRCTVFRSTPPAGPARGVGVGGKGAAAKPVSVLHRLQRSDAAVPEGVDAMTAFTLTDESGGSARSRRAVVARVGTALALFSTLGTAGDPAPAPDERLVRAQAVRLRAAQH